MAKYFKHILLLTSYFFLLSSCQEGSEAGDLLGQWRLTGSDTNYMSFSGSVALFRTTNNGYLEAQIYGNFQHQGDSLFIQCYSVEGLRSDTVIVEESFGFKPFNNIRVKIEALDNDHLILKNDQQSWTFNKY
jgi:hypothetical protein